MIKRNELKEFNIKTRDDVKAFISYIVDDLQCNYHPDDSFEDLVDLMSDERLFDDEAADYLDELNYDCFRVVGDDYYHLMALKLCRYNKLFTKA